MVVAASYVSSHCSLVDFSSPPSESSVSRPSAYSAVNTTATGKHRFIPRENLAY